MSVAATSQIFSFPTEFTSGNLLLSTLNTADLLYTLDLRAAEPKAEKVVSFGSNVTGVTAVVPFEDDLYAVGGGLHTSYAFQKGSMSLFIISLLTRTIIDSIPVPDAPIMNGLATLPYHPHIVVSADSVDGRIYSIDTRAKEVSVMLEDAALGPDSDNTSPIGPVGINGLRTWGDYLYFTNSDRGTLSRFRVGEDGKKIGDFEVLAQSPTTSQTYDEFAFDREGNVYIAVHPESVVRITPDGVQTTIGSSEMGSVVFKEPTSVALANDGKSIYVSTGGNLTANPREGGQVIQITLEE